MANSKFNLYEQIMSNPEFKANLAKLSEDEKRDILQAIKMLTERWENGLLKPLEKLKH